MDPFQGIVFQRLGETVEDGAVEQCQPDQYIRILVNYLHKLLTHIHGDGQFFHAFPHQRLLEALTGFYLAAHEFPEKTSCLIGRPLADQEFVFFPDQCRHHINGLLPGQNHGGDGSHHHLIRNGLDHAGAGGIAVDMWWRTSTKGLFCAGECAGTHGVTRPGGSALNAGQVGSLRAAQYISQNANESIDDNIFEKIAACAQHNAKAEISNITSNANNVESHIENAQRRMSDCAAAIRNVDTMVKALAETKLEIAQLCNIGVKDNSKIYTYYKLKDILYTQSAVLTAMINYSQTVGDTRGSALYFDKKGQLRDGLEEMFRFSEENGNTRAKIQKTSLCENGFISTWRTVRPIPQNDDFFENVWKQYRENKNVF